MIFCSSVIQTTILCENGKSVPQAIRGWFDIFSWSKEQWSNDKTIIELGYRKTSWFVIVSKINLPQQVTDLLAADKSRYYNCTTSLNNC